MEPVWSRDGNALYYRTLDGELVCVTLRPDSRLAITGKASLFRADASLSTHGADYDIDPDGKSFLMLRSRIVDTKLMVITDPFARIKSR